MIEYHDMIRRHCQALDPRPTGVPAQIDPIPGLRAVLFDIYGTLFISASGDVGTAGARPAVASMAEALHAVGISSDYAGVAVEALEQIVVAHHQVRREEGIEFPEVDIREVWHDVLVSVGLRQSTGGGSTNLDVSQLAIEYEMRVNPVWPMPHLRETIAGIRQIGPVLGLVSNAQFFTIELFTATLDESPISLGFDPELQYYSYRYYHAKPGRKLYELANRALSVRGIRPSEVLYVGNDMLNDILPASQIGFRTALFAGDARSLRQRESDSRVRSVRPDVVLTDLAQLLQVI